jgi:hypothetical protein
VCIPLLASSGCCHSRKHLPDRFAFQKIRPELIVIGVNPLDGQF